MKKTLISLSILLTASTAFAAKSGLQETAELEKWTTVKINETLNYAYRACKQDHDPLMPNRDAYVRGALNLATENVVKQRVPGLSNYSCMNQSGTIDLGAIKTEVKSGVVQSAIIYDGSITTTIYPDYYFTTRKMVFADQYYVTFKFNNQTYDWTVNDSRLPFTAGNDTILMGDKSFKLTNNLTLNDLIHDYYSIVEQTEAAITKSGSKIRVSIQSYIGWLLSDREFQNKFIDYVQLNTMPKNARDKVLKQRQENSEKSRLEELKKKYGR